MLDFDEGETIGEYNEVIDALRNLADKRNLVARKIIDIMKSAKDGKNSPEMDEEISEKIEELKLDIDLIESNIDDLTDSIEDIRSRIRELENN